MLLKNSMSLIRSRINYKFSLPYYHIVSRMSTLRQKMKTIKVQKPKKSSQIVSLLSDQLQQLSSLSHYSSSVNFLQKNQLAKSYSHLQFALTESKAKYPQSVNLHMFLLNRMSILQKLLGKSENFLDSLEQVFFMSLSLKGDKSLQTIKHMYNYILALVVSDPIKLKSLIQFLNQNNYKQLLKKIEQFVGISLFINGQKQQGIKFIQSLNIQKIENKYMFLNNLNWLKMLKLSQQRLEYIPKQNSEQLDNIAKNLAEKVGQLTSSTQQIQNNILFTSLLNSCLQKQSDQYFSKINPKTILLNSQSHIISMNIAHAYYLKRKYQIAITFIRLSLQASMQLMQLDRVGLSLLLMCKINQKLALDWEPNILAILKNNNVYSLGVLKHCLQQYSRFLFTQKRFREAQAYMNQANRIQGRLYIEGLVLPDFDLTF